MKTLHFIEECESTNDLILNCIAPEENFTALYTLRQTKGRGQYGNSWLSPAEENIAFTFAVPETSVFLPPHLFNFHTACLVAAFVDTLTASHTEIKWPNDLILKGKKIAGILLEKKKKLGTSYYIVGLGLNVLQEDFRDLRTAGSLLTQTGERFTPHEVAAQLADFLRSKLVQLPSEQEVLDNTHQRLFRKNKISVFRKNGVGQNGIIQQIDRQGYLWIELEEEGLQNFYHKEIEMLY